MRRYYPTVMSIARTVQHHLSTPGRRVPSLRLTFFFVAAAAGVGACVGAGGSTVTPSQRESIAREIVSQVRDAYDLSKPNVDERMLALYGDSGRIVSSTGGHVLTSRDSLASEIHYFWRNIGMNMRQPQWVWTQTFVDVLAPDAAVFTGTYHIPHLTPRGEAHDIGGAMTLVFQKRGGRWVVGQEHLSDAPQLSGAAADSVRGDGGMHMNHQR